MLATGASEAQVVYMTRNKWEIKQWPAHDDDTEGETFAFDPARIEALIQERAIPIRDAIIEHGVPETVDEIPFEKCSNGSDGDPCWLCEKEDLTLPE